MSELAKLKHNYYSYTEYLELEQRDNQRYEYFAGEIFAMARGTFNHGLVSSNGVIALGNSLRNSKCRVIGSDVKLHIATWDKFCYPDIQVLCEHSHRYETYVEGPILVVEVLSESTESYDRGKKFEHYRAIPELCHYLLLHQNRAYAELFTRSNDGQWIFSEVSGMEGILHLSCLKIYLPLAELYRNVET
jgi:Uma2 family endonuclease